MREQSRSSRRALDIRERVVGRDHPDTATSLNNLAALLQDKGDYEGAEPLYRRALDICERVLGKDHPDTATSLNNLAGLLHDKGEYEGAEPLSTAGRWRLLNGYWGETTRIRPTASTTWHYCFKTREIMKEPSRSYRRALDIRERVLGRDHPDTATSLNNLAAVL